MGNAECRKWNERPPGRSSGTSELSPEPEAGDQRPVPLHVVAPHVVEKAPPAADQHEQAAPAVVVLLVRLEVLGEVVDALREDGDLHLGRTGVRLVEAVLADRCGVIGHCGRANSDPVTRLAVAEALGTAYQEVGSAQPSRPWTTRVGAAEPPMDDSGRRSRAAHRRLGSAQPSRPWTTRVGTAEPPMTTGSAEPAHTTFRPCPRGPTWR